MTVLTAALLTALMECDTSRSDLCYPAMIQAMTTFQINTPARIACFCVQVKWESGGLKYFEELADGTAYEGRLDLGNTQPGDGPRFKGSGPIQVTGRANFQAAQNALTTAGVLGFDGQPIDIMAVPALARTVQYGFWISCWWWESHGGNAVADRTPLAAASLACGRLVNRGDANSQYPAQGEQGRIDAFDHIAPFGLITLPDSTPPVVAPPGYTPPPANTLEQIMSDAQLLLAALKDPAVTQYLRAVVWDQHVNGWHASDVLARIDTSTQPVPGLVAAVKKAGGVK